LIAVLDACVLYPPALRDVLMWLATVGAYEPRWTEEIHAELRSLNNIITCVIMSGMYLEEPP
jgi:hypothetical protein